VIYYVIALALYVQSSYREVLRCLLEGWLWLGRARLPMASDAGISQARSRLGVEPFEKLHDELLRPLATNRTRGAFYRQWRLVALDVSTLQPRDAASARGQAQDERLQAASAPRPTPRPHRLQVLRRNT
jgi:hypothetical protein